MPNPNKIKIDKELLAPEDFENTKLWTNDDGSQEEIYISRAGNIVTAPKDRFKAVDGEQQQKCWDLYVKSWKTGKPNGLQAALAAGYSKNTAINIGNQAWFKAKKAKLRRSNMLSRAEYNLGKIMRMNYSKMKIMDDGSEEEVVDKDVLRVVADVSKTIVSTLGKDEGYSTKTEIKGDMSGEIKINSISYADNLDSVENKIIDVVEKVVLEEVIK